MSYDAADNGKKCYAQAIKELRLQGIREGRFEPRISEGVKRSWRRRRGDRTSVSTDTTGA